MEDLGGFLAIIGVFFAPVLVVLIVMAFKYKAHRDTMEAVKSLAQTGTSVTPELLQSLGVKPRLPYANLRTGLIWIAVGIGLSTITVRTEGAEVGGWSAASLPVLIGLVFIGLWVFIDRRKTD